MGVDPDKWSLGRGWQIALRIMGMRALLILGGVAACAYLIWPVVEEIIALGLATLIWLIFLFLFATVAGGWMASLLVDDVVEDSGIMGRHLLIPALLILTVAEVAALSLVAVLRGQPLAVVVVPFGGMLLAGWLTCLAKLVLM
jgi:hypothetical protein